MDAILERLKREVTTKVGELKQQEHKLELAHMTRAAAELGKQLDTEAQQPRSNNAFKKLKRALNKREQEASQAISKLLSIRNAQPSTETDQMTEAPDSSCAAVHSRTKPARLRNSAGDDSASQSLQTPGQYTRADETDAAARAPGLVHWQQTVVPQHHDAVQKDQVDTFQYCRGKRKFSKQEQNKQRLGEQVDMLLIAQHKPMQGLCVGKLNRRQRRQVASLSKPYSPQSAQQVGSHPDQNTGAPEQATPTAEMAKWWEGFDGVDPVEAADQAIEELARACGGGQYKQHRKLDRTRRAAARKSFHLQSIVDQMHALASQQLGERLELPPFSRVQRMQVQAIADIFSLEARACGRAGQTFFVGRHTHPATAENNVQIASLLEGLVRHGRICKQKLCKLGSVSATTLEAGLKRPLSEDNKGSQMLRALGWSEGQGLGAQEQGIIEPIAVKRRKQQEGLGHKL